MTILDRLFGRTKSGDASGRRCEVMTTAMRQCRNDAALYHGGVPMCMAHIYLAGGE